MPDELRVQWSDPPPAAEKPSPWEILLTQLMERPGSWALLREGYADRHATYNAVWYVRSQVIPEKFPDHEFQLHPVDRAIWGVYLGEKEDDGDTNSGDASDGDGQRRAG